MPVLPVPIIISLLLLGLLVQRLLTRETHPTLLALIAACGLQSAILALVQYYGILAIRPIQPIMATLIPPIAWLAFNQATGESYKINKIFWHAIGPVLAIICLLVQPMWLDILIPLSFAAYGGSMLLLLSRGEDSLLHSRLESGSQSLLAWRIVASSLIASAACDLIIAYGLANGIAGFLLWVPSVVSSLSLLSLGALSVSHAMESRRDLEEASPTPEDAARDQTIMARLDDYITSQKPYLDPDLTLARLSRKLLIPAKQLSTAINRVKGENVSRYINRQRIEEACRKLEAGHSVTMAMLDSGFNTKSNFNREFLRLKNLSPSKWLENQSDAL
jgi:AraC-like DNA-binding protein